MVSDTSRNGGDNMIGLRRRTMGNIKSAFPSGYTRLQYVDNQGAAYCDTGILVSGDMTFEAKIRIYENYASGHNFLLGGGANQNQTRNSVGAYILTNNNFRTIYRISNGSTSANLVKDTWYDIALNTDGFYLDNVLVNAVTRTTFNGTVGFHLGVYYNSAAANQAPAYELIGDCKVNDVDFIPAKRDSDDAVGFLRMSDKVFLTSDSATPFLAGPNY